MKKKLNTISLIAAIFSILAVVFTTIGLIIEFTQFDVSNFQNWISTLVAIPFAIMELTNGINILKLRKKENKNGELVPVFGLLNSIVYGVSVIRVVGLYGSDIFSDVTGDKLFSSFGAVLAIIMLIISVLDNKIIRKKEYGKIAKLGVVLSSITAIYFAVFLGIWNEGIIDIISDVSNLIIVVLVLVYCIYAIKYYQQNSESIQESNLNEEDFDVIKSKNGKTKIKVYASRGEHSLATTIFCWLGIATLSAGLILVLVYSLKEFFDPKNNSVSYIMYLFICLILAIMSTLCIVNVLRAVLGLIRHSTNGIAIIPWLVRARTIPLAVFIFEIAGPLLALFEGGDIKELVNADNIVFVLLFVVTLIPELVAMNLFKKYNDAIRNGGFISEEKVAFGLTNILYFSSSLPLALYPLIKQYVDGLYQLSIIFIAISFVLFIIFGILYIKNPLKETFNKNIKADIKNLQK